MSEEIRIVKHLESFIKSCKTYFGDYRKICIVTRNGKYGLAENDKKEGLKLLCEVEFDYIEPFCNRFGNANMFGVYSKGKCGLIAMDFTVSSVSDDIGCELVAKCEYDKITFLQESNIAFLYDEKKEQRRYYNLNTRRLSPCYKSFFERGTDSIICEKDHIWHLVDTTTDSVIYTCHRGKHIDLLLYVSQADLFLMFDCDYKKILSADLLFYNRNLRESYVIENINCLNVMRNGYEDFEETIVVSFKKDGKKFFFACVDSEWNFDEIRKIAKEVDYT